MRPSPDPSNPQELEARQREIAAALDHVLVDGERWLVQLDRDHVHVSAAEHDTAGRSVLRFTHPALYGQIVAANERVRSAGGIFNVAFALLLAIAGVASIEAGWLAGIWSAETLAALSNGWVYGAFAVAVLLAVTRLRRAAAWRQYRQEVDGVLRACRGEGIEPSHLIALLEGDFATDRFLGSFKRDTRVGEIRP